MIKIEYLDDPGIVKYTYIGEVSVKGRLKGLELLVEVCKKHNCKKVFFDLSLQYSQASLKEEYSIARVFVRKMKGFKIAGIHNPKSINIPFIRHVVKNHNSHQNQRFYNEEDAIRWLLQKEPTFIEI